MPLQETSGTASYDAFGGGAAAVPNYIEDVFSTYLYTGNGSTQTITNGIDLAGKGGLVWIKDRSAAIDNALFDTVRGIGSGPLVSNSTLQAGWGAATTLTAFNSNGFDVSYPGSGSFIAATNRSPDTYASWTFRKQPKFFDVVTYTGNGSNTTIAHNLGSVPGCIMVKRTDTTGAWQVYHRSLANTEYMVLNTTAAKATGATRWNSTTPTSTVFSLGTDATVNANNGTYVAYLFAHDAGGFGLTGTDNVISCGSFTTDASGNATVSLGYEPQWLMIKASSTTDNWWVWDTMRGWSLNGYALLQPNTSAAESTGSSTLGYPTATGFTIAGLPPSSSTCIYIAIRRGPMKTPTSGTSVFAPITYAGNNTASRVISGLINAPDWVLYTARNAGAGLNNHITGSRLQGGGRYLLTEDTSSEASSTAYGVQTYGQTSVTLGTATTAEQNASGVNYILYGMGRAPGFFDVVCYTGTGSNLDVTHNLGVIPELVIVKSRSTTGDWCVYNQNAPISSGTLRQTLFLNLTSAWNTQQYWRDTPTASVVKLETGAEVNTSGATYAMYLFASAAGISKVGSYTGNGSSQTINCGFTGGARFVMIKRTDSTGDWYVYDTARGMTTLTDPYLLMNSTAAESATLGSVTTVSTGFAVNASILAAINTNGGSYIFLAIS